MFPTHQRNRAITSTACMVILSIIPSDVVRTGAVVLGGIACLVNLALAVRPRVLMEKLHMRLLSLEGKLQAALDSGVMAQTDGIFIVKFEGSIGRIRYRIPVLHERTLLASGVLQEINAVWRGHSLEIIKCLRDVDALERELEINHARVLQKRYYPWR